MKHAGVSRLSSLILGAILSSLISVLLMLGGTALIEDTSAIGNEPSLSCVAFQVGSPSAASTHTYLENRGPDGISVQFDFIDDGGLTSWAQSYSRRMAPWASD